MRSPDFNEGADTAGSPAPLKAALHELAEENDRIRALGARSAASAAAALDGFATGDALRTALTRWQHRADAVAESLAEASTALGDSPDPGA
ncbi:hypothetical protein OH807_07000 [Kitasatospora sp. NBC_01560]|uniref:hypothetical protein n=1 Tax=Kitasatospora sp. NBC_01560 TaxID=2975965 RepID=UPI00386D1D0D